MTAEMLGASPESVLLVGIAGACYDPGCSPAEAITQSVGQAIDTILRELERLGFSFQKRVLPQEPRIWWGDNPRSDSALPLG